MDLSEQELPEFGAALNEACLIGVAIDAAKRSASLTFRVLPLPEGDGPSPEDPPCARGAAPIRPSQRCCDTVPGTIPSP